MNIHLISGGCGFVGRNLVRRLYHTTSDTLVIVDDLSTGQHPSEWLADETVVHDGAIQIIGASRRLFFVQDDFRVILRNLDDEPRWFQNNLKLDFNRFKDVFHFAAIVGGRATIEGDPLRVALDLSIDADFFYWVTRHKPERVLYPSSSAAYPVHMQEESGARALAERDIDFRRIAQPDMTYGWSKITGEYLAKMAAKHYGLAVTCIRPFTGYGEDQDLTYPIPAIAHRIARHEDPIEVWGTGEQGRDFIHIDDVLDCMFMAMDHITDGSAINVGSGQLISFREVIAEFSKIAGYHPEVKQLLDRPVGVHSRFSDVTLVHELLGWSPKVSLEEGLRRMYDTAKERISS